MAARWVLVAVLSLGVGCGGDDDREEADAAVLDAASGAADAALTDGSASDGSATDAPPGTRCPPTEGLYCELATEICVIEGPVGPANTSSCQAVPSGCESDRTCECVAATLCEAPFDTCSPGQVDNSVFCECVSCQ